MNTRNIIYNEPAMQLITVIFLLWYYYVSCMRRLLKTKLNQTNQTYDRCLHSQLPRTWAGTNCYSFYIILNMSTNKVRNWAFLVSIELFNRKLQTGTREYRKNWVIVIPILKNRVWNSHSDSKTFVWEMKMKNRLWS